MMKQEYEEMIHVIERIDSSQYWDMQNYLNAHGKFPESKIKQHDYEVVKSALMLVRYELTKTFKPVETTFEKTHRS